MPHTLRSSQVFGLLGLLATIAAALSLASIPAHSQVRITEVLANPTGPDVGNQLVEITNVGNSVADISGWRICVQLTYRTFQSPLFLDPDETFTVHIRAAGTNDDNNFYTDTFYPALVVADDSFGLYGPSGLFSDPAAMRDFVQWGAPLQPRENVANSAGLWVAGDFAAVPSEGLSLGLCDEAGGSSAFWLAGVPTVGGLNSCLAPAPNVILSEALVDPVGSNTGNQLIEIQNLEASTVDLSNWQICFQFTYWGLPAGTVLGAGDFLVVHVNAAGTDDPSNVYTGPFVDMSTSDALSLYRHGINFDDSANIIDFVQWGGAALPREDLAVTAGLWTAGQFLPGSTEGRSLERCNPSPGASSWNETPGLTFGASNSCNPVSVPDVPILVNKVGRPTPNPTLGNTTLSFELATAARVRARVLDARGRLVTDLGYRVYPAGANSLVWDGTDTGGNRLAAGAYWIQLRSDQVLTPEGRPWSATVRVIRLRSGG
jgi:hypothetical protein